MNRSAYAIVTNFDRSIDLIAHMKTQHEEELQQYQARLEAQAEAIRQAEAEVIALMDHNGVNRIALGQHVYTIKARAYADGRDLIRTEAPEIPSAWDLKSPEIAPAGPTAATATEEIGEL